MCRVSCRLGQKNPLFPWGFIRSILIEHEVKLECVSVSVNGVLAITNGSVVGEEEVLRNECEKREVR